MDLQLVGADELLPAHSTERSILVEAQETISLNLGRFLWSKPTDQKGLRVLYLVLMRPDAHHALGMCGGGTVFEAECRAKCSGLHSLVKGGGAGLNDNKLYKFWFRYSAAPSLRALSQSGDTHRTRSNPADKASSQKLWPGTGGTRDPDVLASAVFLIHGESTAETLGSGCL